MGYRQSVSNFQSDVGNVVKFSIHSVEAYHLNLSAWQITSSYWIYWQWYVAITISNFQFVEILICHIVAYHLLYLYESLLFLFPLLLYEICRSIISKIPITMIALFSNFHSIFAMIGNRSANKFSTITQPWRHPGAILWIHVIIHIFITIYDKLIKFNTHKLQVITQQTDNPCARVRHDAHVRARQNLEMLKITYKQFCIRTRSFTAFQNFPSVRVRARVVRAYSAQKRQNSKFSHDFNSSHHN